MERPSPVYVMTAWSGPPRCAPNNGWVDSVAHTCSEIAALTDSVQDLQHQLAAVVADAQRWPGDQRRQVLAGLVQVAADSDLAENNSCRTQKGMGKEAPHCLCSGTPPSSGRLDRPTRGR